VLGLFAVLPWRKRWAAGADRPRDPLESCSCCDPRFFRRRPRWRTSSRSSGFFMVDRASGFCPTREQGLATWRHDEPAGRHPTNGHPDHEARSSTARVPPRCGKPPTTVLTRCDTAILRPTLGLCCSRLCDRGPSGGTARIRRRHEIHKTRPCCGTSPPAYGTHHGPLRFPCGQGAGFSGNL